MDKARSIKSLLGSYNPAHIKKIRRLKFIGVEGRDVYNITSPFRIKRTFYLLGRVEPRDDETSAKAMFFRRPRGSNKWFLDENTPVYNLQDPFIFKFRDTNIFGGVEIKKTPREKVRYRNVFYNGKDLHRFRSFARGPWGMKGIRFVYLPNKKIGVFTRPQGKKGRRGKIGFETVDALNKITPRRLSRAEIIHGMFKRGEWGGVNQVHVLKNGKLGVLGHIAMFGKDKHRYYYPIVFMFDYETNEFSNMKIIATRSDLPDGHSKREELYHVIYPGGIVREGRLAKLYAGVSDAESYEITMEDPFLEYEESPEEKEENL